MILKKRYKHFSIVYTSIIILIISACNTDVIGDFRFKVQTRNFESQVLRSYFHYINELNLPELKQAAFHDDNPDFFRNTSKKCIFTGDHMLQFFPATLWQVYKLKGKSKWERRAEDVSKLFIEEKISDLNNEGLLQGVLMNPFLITGNPLYKETLLKILSDHIVSEEIIISGCVSGDTIITSTEKLLNNQLLFFASEETGDPVYRYLALQNAERIYNHQFLNNSSNELYYGLANWERIPSLNELKELSQQDYYMLALCFYGFTLIEKETGINRYNDISDKLASVFLAVFENAETENNQINSNTGPLLENIDLMSILFACLAYNNMNFGSTNDYQKSKEGILSYALNGLEQADIADKKIYNFRIFYYLFEYIIQQKTNNLI